MDTSTGEREGGTVISAELGSLISALCWPPSMSKEEFLREVGAEDGVSLGATLLKDAVERRDPGDVESAPSVCFTFGFADAHLRSLHDWIGP